MWPVDVGWCSGRRRRKLPRGWGIQRSRARMDSRRSTYGHPHTLVRRISEWYGRYDARTYLDGHASRCGTRGRCSGTSAAHHRAGRLRVASFTRRPRFRAGWRVGMRCDSRGDLSGSRPRVRGSLGNSSIELGLLAKERREEPVSPCSFFALIMGRKCSQILHLGRGQRSLSRAPATTGRGCKGQGTYRE